MLPLDAWIDRQYRISANAIMQSVSPRTIKERPGFAQRIVPQPGAIVASPVLGNWDPEPDYYFHWFRDSALVLDALRHLHEDAELGLDLVPVLHDFIGFSGALQRLDGAVKNADDGWRARVQADYQRHLRSASDLASVTPGTVVGDTRVNADGSLDITSWTRPQYDGAALRALTLLRWDCLMLPEPTRGALRELLRADLEFVRNHWHVEAFDMWEEERGLHYYTVRASESALAHGAAALQAWGDASEARALHAAALQAQTRLNEFWCEEQHIVRSRLFAVGARSVKELDIAVIFAAIHTAAESGPNSPRDPHLQATLGALETLFGSEYAINARRAGDEGPAMGRYAGDVYYSGGAYYFSTLAAAQFCFCAANGATTRDWLVRGDAYLRTVRRYTPENGELSEQFDGHSGAQTSARQLAWSYAAFITCTAARRHALKKHYTKER